MVRLKRVSLPGFFAAIIFFLLFSGRPVLSGTASVATYDGLIKAIRQTRATSVARIENAARQEKVREAWETGRLIDEHVLLHKERADYGKEVLKRLCNDLGTSKTELYYMLQFARAYPIFPIAGKLAWGHYRELLSVKDEAKRKSLEDRAIQAHWTKDELREVIRKEVGPSPDDNGPDVPDDRDSKLPDIRPGPLDTYAIIRLKDRLVVDLGFGIYRDLPQPWAVKFEDGSIVKIENGKHKSVPKATLYTYRARVTQVVDGDTFHALIDLGFETTVALRVRLRRIDAPELATAEGKEAKAYLEKILKRDEGRVIIQSHELDQHGRPIADVWCHGQSVDAELLDQGLAVKME